MKTVRTALQLLTLLSADRPALTVSGAAAHFGISMSASSRLLAAMSASGLIQKGADRAYRPGPLAYRLGLLYHSHNQLADLVQIAARRLVTETGFTCWVSILATGDAMLISRLPGRADHGFHVDAGNLLPAHASAAGKALLARMSDDQVRDILKSSSLARWAARTKTDVDLVLADVGAIRERGWSIIADELFDDVTSVGVALRAPNEATAMAISLSIPGAARSVPEITRTVGHLVSIAHETATMVADPFWTDARRLQSETAIAAEIRAYLAAKPKAAVTRRRLVECNGRPPKPAGTRKRSSRVTAG